MSRRSTDLGSATRGLSVLEALPAKTEKMKNMSKNIYDDDGEYEEYQYSYLTVPTKEFKETLVDEGGGRMSIFVRPNLPDYDEVPDGRVPRIPRHGPIAPERISSSGDYSYSSQKDSQTSLDSFWNPTDRNGNFKTRESLAETSFYADDDVYFPNPPSSGDLGRSHQFAENFTQVSRIENEVQSAQVSNIEQEAKGVQAKEIVENDDKSAQVNLASLIDPYLKDSGNQTSRKTSEEKSVEALILTTRETAEIGNQVSRSIFSDESNDDEPELLFQNIETQVSESLALLCEEAPSISPEPELEIDSDGEYYLSTGPAENEEIPSESALDAQIAEITRLVEIAPFYRIVRWIEFFVYSYACLYLFVHCFASAETFY